MTIGWGDTGRVTVGIQREMDITLAVAENNVTPTALPTAMGAAQHTFTYDPAALAPTFTGVHPLSYSQVWIMVVSGQNTSGAAATVNYQINKNGASYKTGSLSVTNNNYFTLSLEMPMASGDVYDFYLWTSSASGVNYIYNGCCSIPTRVDIGNKMILGSTWTTAPASASFTLTGKVSSQWGGSLFLIIGSNTSPTNAKTVANGETVYLYQTHPTYKMFLLQSDIATPNYALAQSATAYPQLEQNYYPTKITWRELSL